MPLSHTFPQLGLCSFLWWKWSWGFQDPVGPPNVPGVPSSWVELLSPPQSGRAIPTAQGSPSRLCTCLPLGAAWVPSG
jgi:hypothetical protein